MASSRQRGGASLSDYAQMVWQRRWIVVMVVVLVAAAELITRPPPPQPLYSSTVTLRVNSFGFSGSSEGAVVPNEEVPPAEIEKARSLDVAVETIDELGLSENGVDLLSDLVVTIQEGTDLLQLNLTGPGVRTTEVLETYARNYVDFREQQDEERLRQAVADFESSIAALETQLDEMSDRLQAEQDAGEVSPRTQSQYNVIEENYGEQLHGLYQLKLDAALTGNQVELVGSPINERLGSVPTRTLRLLAGPLVGLLLGCALAVGLGMLRPRISGRERTEERLGYPVLATIPRVRERGIAREPLLLQRTSGWAAEGLRMLRTELQLIEERGTPLKMVAVASPEPRDGKSTVAANLAGSYAASGKNVVLVHADLRASHKKSVDGQKGLSDFLAGRVKDVPVVRNPSGFDEVLAGGASGTGLPGSQELLVEAMTRLTERYDIIIIDTAPLLAFADALLLAIEASAVVLVLRNGKTLEDKAMEALEVLVRHNAAVAGIVLNDISVGRLQRYRYRRYYSAWAEEETVEEPAAASTPAPPQRESPKKSDDLPASYPNEPARRR